MGDYSAAGAMGRRTLAPPGETALAGAQRGKPVAEHDVVAGDDAALERNALALLPHLGADRVAGKHRARESRLDAFQPLRPALGARAQDRPRRDAEARRPVQDRPVEARGLGALGIGMQRILVAVEAVEEREIGRRRQIADLVWWALGHRVGLGRLRRLAAET